MDEFNQNFNNENNEETGEFKQEEYTPSQPDVELGDTNYDNVTSDVPMWNKVEYSPVEKIEDYKSAGKGLKVFCLVMVAVVLLTATTAAGYFWGKMSFNTEKNIEVNLAARPIDTEMSTPAQVYEKVNESVVGIRVYNEAGQGGDASGVIYSEDGYIVTNDHIYTNVGKPKFKVFMHDGTEYDAVYVAGDTISDLAILKIENGKNFKPATFGDSETIFNGEPVVAIGRPSDATDKSSITSGVVSLTSRRVQMTTSSYSSRLIQTDSAINPGSSGGALVNMYGQVIGITSSKLAGEDIDAIGFAIPTRTMKRVAEQLIKDGKVTDRAKLGISYNEINSVTAEIEKYDSVGLLVRSVSDDSDAFGKIKEKDIITHVNGILITNDEILLDIIEDSKAGDTILISVLLEKTGEIIDLEVKLNANIGESSYSDTIREQRPLPELEEDEEKLPLPDFEDEEEDDEKSDGGKVW